MADVITRLRLESGEYDSKIKRAIQGLLQMEQECRKVGGTLAVLEKDQLQYVQSLGQMQAVATTTRGKMSELTQAYTELRIQYNRLTEEEKRGDFGRALSASLDQLKTRIQDTKKQLGDVNKELQGSKFGEFGAIIDSVGQKMGISGNLTEMLTSKTALLKMGYAALAAAAYEATNAFVAYNKELAQQDNVTQVTTGLSGADADRLTDMARAMVDTYKVDFREVINAANTLMSQFGESGATAMQLIRDGMQGMIQGDGPKLLSMIQQYAPAFNDAGISASQLVAIIHNSEGGIFTDQNMNAIVMGIRNIRLMTESTSKALAQLGIDGEEMSKKMNDGSMTVFEALKQVAAKLKDTESGSQTAGEVMQAVFGRQGTAAGTKLAEAIETLNTNLEETKRQTGELGDAYAELQTANEKLNVAIRDCFEYDGWEQMATGIKSKLITALASVLEYCNKVKLAIQSIWSMKAATQLAEQGGQEIIQNQLDQLKGKSVNEMGRIRDNTLINYDRSIKAMDRSIAFQKEHGRPTSNQEAQRQAIINMKSAYETMASAAIAEAREKSKNKEPESPKNPKGTTGTEPPKHPKGSGGSGQTDQQRAEKQVSDALAKYGQAVDLATKNMEAGNTTDTDYKKTLLQQQQRLYDAYGQAYQTYADPKYKEAQDAAAAEIVRLGGEVKEATEAQKAVQEAARQLEQAHTKLADAQQELATAQSANDLKGIYSAKAKVDAAQAKVDELEGKVPIVPTIMEGAWASLGADIQKKILAVGQPSVTVGVTATQQNIDAFKAHLKDELGKADIGSDLYNNLSAQLADATLLGNLIQEAVKHGIELPEDVVSEFWGSIFNENAGDYISSEAWQSLIDKLNEAIVAQGGEPIAADFATGGVSESKGGSKGDDALPLLQSAASGLSQVANGLKQFGIEMPSGVQKLMSGMQGVVSVIQGVQTILGVINTLTTSTTVPSTTANTSAVLSNTTMMAALIAAMKLNTATSIIPFANGGVVRAAGGWVSGAAFSGDNIPALLNSGELVLNRAQQGVLAQELSGDDEQGGGQLSVRVSAEDLIFVLNRYGTRRGLGKLIND